MGSTVGGGGIDGDEVKTVREREREEKRVRGVRSVVKMSSSEGVSKGDEGRE